MMRLQTPRGRKAREQPSSRHKVLPGPGTQPPALRPARASPHPTPAPPPGARAEAGGGLGCVARCPPTSGKSCTAAARVRTTPGSRWPAGGPGPGAPLPARPRAPRPMIFGKKVLMANLVFIFKVLTMIFLG